MDLTCSVGYSLVVHIQKDMFFGLSLMLCMIFKISNQFSENVIFEKFIKILSSQKLQFFECFSVWCTMQFTCTQ